MESVLDLKTNFDTKEAPHNAEETKEQMTILDAVPGETYTIKSIDTEDEEMNGFLFRLGCYSGEPITLISKKKKNCIVVIKDGRYNLDNLLAEAILV